MTLMQKKQISPSYFQYKRALAKKENGKNRTSLLKLMINSLRRLVFQSGEIKS